MTPAIRPMNIGDAPDTYPAAGVIATRPATMPEAAPRFVGCPSRIHSTTTQARPAAAAAKKVLRNACAAWPLEASADPALTPNQPNHRIPVPIMTSGIECGGDGCDVRLPSTSTAASAAMPALTWMAVPPAKSSEPRWPSQPPYTHLKIGT